MKVREDLLDRLFKAARQAPPANEPADIPGHLETRILAEWRSGGAEPRGGALALVLRWGLMGAAAVMLVSIAWASFSPADDFDNDDDVANYELREDLMP
jgi:hypothetical protein